MYKVIKNGKSIGYSDTIVYIKLAKNGCYVPCEQNNADGFCVKIPYQYTDDDGNTVDTVKDTVFQLNGKQLNGSEGTASVEYVNGGLLINEANQTINTLVDELDNANVVSVSKIQKNFLA